MSVSSFSFELLALKFLLMIFGTAGLISPIYELNFFLLVADTAKPISFIRRLTTFSDMMIPSFFNAFLSFYNHSSDMMLEIFL